MSLFFLVVFMLYTAVYGLISSHVNDIICNKSQTECNVDCADSSIHCHDITIYSSSNRTIIQCQQESPCTNLQIHCQQTNECILRCAHGACFNTTLICNTNIPHSTCECRGVGCPSIPVLNSDDIEEDDDKYTVDQSLVMIFFVAFFAVVLCCFCVLIVALCMGVLYFSEKKKQRNLCRHIEELKHNKKISFLSSRSSTSKDKYDKSEATVNIHRMTLSRSHKNRSYDTTVSAMVSDAIDDKESQMLMMSPTTDDIFTIKTYGMTRDSEEKHDMELVVNKDANDYIEEEQKEGDKHDLRLQKFDSEDLYIMQPQSTLQYRTKYSASTTILDNTDIGSSDDHCIPHSDDSSDNMSAYTMDGHNTKQQHMRIEKDTKHMTIDIVHDQDINVDISAQLPTSPQVHDGDTITKHPPKQALLRPHTVKGGSPTYHGTQNSDAASSNSSEDSEFSLSISKHNKDMIASGEDEKEGMNRLNRMNHLQPIPETMNNNKQSISLTTCATYHESGDYKEAMHALHNPLRISRASPPPQIRSVSQSTDLQSESTFTIKSAVGTGNNSELSRQSVSLNSAAAVCIAFPDAHKKVHFHHKIPNYVQKQKHYYNAQAHHKRNLGIFDVNHNKLSITPLNSPMEKPMIISKAPSTTAMVPSLPSSPRTCIIEDEDGYIPSPALLMAHPMSDDTVMRSRGRDRNKNNERKTRSRSKSKTRGTRSASNDTILYIHKKGYRRNEDNNKRNIWKNHHETVPSYSNSREQGMDHNITLLEPHIISEILDDCDEIQSGEDANDDDDVGSDNKEGRNNVNISYRATSKSTGNIVHHTNSRKIKIKRNSKPIIKVYRNKSSKSNIMSNIVLPTNEFNKNGNEMKLRDGTVAWNTTITMTPPPPPILFSDDNSNKRRSRKFSAKTPLAAIIPSQSSFISNICK